MKNKTWIIGWLTIVVSVLVVLGIYVYRVDPYFHYHIPDISNYYYYLNNERSQNDGICKYFDYDALITGTSMTENFKTSELNEMFDVNSIKVSYAGGTYKEINDNLKNALKNNEKLGMIVRGLDVGMFFDDSNRMWDDPKKYPNYLYDSNPFNDVCYLFNKDVIFNRVYAMIRANDVEGFEPGITSFDDYSRWQSVFGTKKVLDGAEVVYGGVGSPVHLTDEEKRIIFNNITQNVTSLADEYPDTDFYYFFTPYSIIWYKGLVEDGTIYRQIEAEEYIIELILEHKNIRLFSLSDEFKIISNINNYKDEQHYGSWINSYILRCMHDDLHRLTQENYKKYIEDELKLLVDFDYNSLNEQDDYQNDIYAEALLNESIWCVKPIDFIEDCGDSIELLNAEFVDNQYDGSKGIRCIGSLKRDCMQEISVEDYIRYVEYIGAKIQVRDISKYKYLVFYGRKILNHAQPTVLVVDSNDNIVGEVMEKYLDIDDEWHQYIIDLSSVEGDITVYFNGGYIDSTGSIESEYIFSNITLF